MDDKDEIIKILHTRIGELESKVSYLEGLLGHAPIPDEAHRAIASAIAPAIVRNVGIIPEAITQEHARFFYSMFKGRRDVYSKRGGKPNPKSGKTGYYTQCWNFWKSGVCPKMMGHQIKCADCKNQHYKELMGGDIMRHLLGAREDCADVIGLYPMHPDETCFFLVFDFDNHDSLSNGEDSSHTDDAWQEEVEAMREICRHNAIPSLVERSRSGKGAHLWLFFAQAIPSAMARRFGTALLTKGAEAVNMKNFKSYDRMLPAQDHMPAGGLGNLIALPLQGQALKHGNSAFIDENWNAYPDQWRVLRECSKIPKTFIEEKITAWSADGILGVLAAPLDDEKQDKTKPWEKQKGLFESSDAEGVVKINIANQVFIDTRNLKPRLQNQMRRLAAFSNPKFYKNQAMGFSTQGIARIIACSQDKDPYICLPRGCEEALIQKLEGANISYQKDDYKQKGKKLSITFQGQLYPEQQKATDIILQHDIGILSAATAFGKTAVGAYIVAARKVNTLILVHNTEIMRNWVEDFAKFLHIDEALPEYQTASGKKRKRKSLIGRLSSNHNSLTGLVDIAMISSLGKGADIHPLVKEYGLVIMDECHHGASQTSEAVLKEVNAQYVYGLTATPKRDDGLEQKMLMQLGAIRYRYTAKDRAREQGIHHYVYPRFTRLVHENNEKLTINQAYQLVRESAVRNEQIVKDVKDCLAQGRTPLVMTKFKDHAAYLYQCLQSCSKHIFLLQGGKSAKERDLLRAQMKAVPEDESIILVAIGQYIGEGFNYPRLDTMMLTTPIAWQGNVEQYAGRLHRDYEGKKEVIIYDYVDSHIRVLERMYHKRLRAYKKIGYEICSQLQDQKQEANAIYDCKSYLLIYERDILRANKSIIISSPGINEKKVRYLIDLVRENQTHGVTTHIITLKAENYPEKRVEKTQQLINLLTQVGISVTQMDEMHEHYAIIDQEIVWYGSMNLLSREKEDDNLMRLVSKTIAQELMEISFGQ